jgi:hypothetical protein
MTNSDCGHLGLLLGQIVTPEVATTVGLAQGHKPEEKKKAKYKKPLRLISPSLSLSLQLIVC